MGWVVGGGWWGDGVTGVVGWWALEVRRRGGGWWGVQDLELNTQYSGFGI